ncbi:hypothetical protein ACIRPX_34725 [Streptomyces sp. NPDC101225]|uniref:hypothetical protein n=1 Tax=Streptomyces sp. NPDC101225 TaxID=3366135 RepID=UPI0037FF1C4C
MQPQRSVRNNLTFLGRLENAWAAGLADSDPAQGLARLRELLPRFEERPEQTAGLWLSFQESLLTGPFLPLLEEADLDRLRDLGERMAGTAQTGLQQSWFPLAGALAARGRPGDRPWAEDLLTRLYRSGRAFEEARVGAAATLARWGADGDASLGVYADLLARHARPPREVADHVAGLLAAGFADPAPRIARAEALARQLAATRPLPGVERTLGYGELLLHDRPAEAAERFETALRADPDDASALHGLLAARLHCGDFARAAGAAAGRGHLLTPRAARLLDLCRMLAWLEEVPGAGADQVPPPLTAGLLAATEPGPDTGPWQPYALGRAYLLEGDHVRARQHLLPLAEQLPGRADIAYHAAWALLLGGEADAAAERCLDWLGRPGGWALVCLLLDADPDLAPAGDRSAGFAAGAGGLAPLAQARLRLTAGWRPPVLPEWDGLDTRGAGLPYLLEALRTMLGVEIARGRPEAAQRLTWLPLFRRLPHAERLLWHGVLALPGDPERARELLHTARDRGRDRAGVLLAVLELKAGRTADVTALLHGVRGRKAELLRAQAEVCAGRTGAAEERLTGLVRRGLPRARHAAGELGLRQAAVHWAAGRADEAVRYAEQAAARLTDAAVTGPDALPPVPDEARALSRAARLLAERAARPGTGPSPWRAVRHRARTGRFLGFAQLLAEPQHAEPVLVEALTDWTGRDQAGPLAVALAHSRALATDPSTRSELDAALAHLAERHPVPEVRRAALTTARLAALSAGAEPDAADQGGVDPVLALEAALPALATGGHDAAVRLLRAAAAEHAGEPPTRNGRSTRAPRVRQEARTGGDGPAGSGAGSAGAGAGAAGSGAGPVGSGGGSSGSAVGSSGSSGSSGAGSAGSAGSGAVSAESGAGPVGSGAGAAESAVGSAGSGGGSSGSAGGSSGSGVGPAGSGGGSSGSAVGSSGSGAGLAGSGVGPVGSGGGSSGSSAGSSGSGAGSAGSGVGAPGSGAGSAGSGAGVPGSGAGSAGSGVGPPGAGGRSVGARAESARSGVGATGWDIRSGVSASLDVPDAEATSTPLAGQVVPPRAPDDGTGPEEARARRVAGFLAGALDGLPPDGEPPADGVPGLAAPLLVARAAGLVRTDAPRAADLLTRALAEHDVAGLVDLDRALPALCARVARGKRRGDATEALKAAVRRQAADAADADGTALLTLVRCAAVVGDHDTAEDLWRRALLQAPEAREEYGAYLCHRAVAAYADKDRTGALALLRKAAGLLPADHPVHAETAALERDDRVDALLAVLLPDIVAGLERRGRYRLIEDLVAGRPALWRVLEEDDEPGTVRELDRCLSTHGPDVPLAHTFAAVYREAALGTVARTGTAGPELVSATALWTLLLAHPGFWRETGTPDADSAGLRRELADELLELHRAHGARCLDRQEETAARMHLRCLEAVRDGPAATRGLLADGPLGFVAPDDVDEELFAGIAARAGVLLDEWATELVRTATRRVDDPAALKRLPRGIDGDYEAGIEMLNTAVRQGFAPTSVLCTVLEWHNRWQTRLYELDERDRMREVARKAARTADLLAERSTEGRPYARENQALGMHFVDRGLLERSTQDSVRLLERAKAWDPANPSVDKLLEQARREALFGTALDHIRAKRYERALAELDRIPRNASTQELLDTMRATTLINQGYVDLRQNRFGEAEARIHDAQGVAGAMSAEDGRLRQDAGQALKDVARARNAQGVGLVEQAMDRIGKLPGTGFRPTLRDETANIRTAMHHFREALRIDPDLQAARDNLAAAEDIIRRLGHYGDY